MGSTPRPVIFGKGRHFDDRTATRFRGGKSGPFGHQEGISGNAQGGMVVKPPPASTLEMSKADLLFQFEIVSLNAPSKFCRANKMSERDVRSQCRKPEFRRRVLIGGHSVKNHSPGGAFFPASRTGAERTLTRAKRDDKTSFVPSRQRIVLQLFFGSARASFSTLIGVLSLRPRREFTDCGEATVSGAQTVFVVLTPATYLRSRALISL